MADTLHVQPADDLTEHSAAEEIPCACGPRFESTRWPDGSVLWLIVHRAPPAAGELRPFPDQGYGLRLRLAELRAAQ